MIESPSLYPRIRSYYRNLVPLFEKPKVAAYTMLVLSFFTVAIFGSFAIRPTLATIVQLKKKIDDNKSVYDRMEEKIGKLRQAEIEYKNVTPDLEAIFKALPTKPQAAGLLGKLNRTLSENRIHVTILQFTPIELVEPEASTSATSTKPIGFTLNGSGSYDDMLSFINLLYQMDRIVTIDSVDIAKPQVTDQSNIPADALTLVIRGKSYVLLESPPIVR